MVSRHLSEDDWNFIVEALRCAAVHYEQRATVAASCRQPLFVEQLTLQAEKARELANNIE